MGAMQTLKSLLLACLLVAATAAEDLTPKVAEDGTVTTVSAQFPFSSWASPQALTRFREILREDKGAPGIADPLASRKFYDKINSDRAERMKKLYPVQVEATTIAGVPVAIVSTAVSNSDPRRVLINLHGGAFLWAPAAAAWSSRSDREPLEDRGCHGRLSTRTREYLSGGHRGR
jgi:epsilon-lactone hydrolase